MAGIVSSSFFMFDVAEIGLSVLAVEDIWGIGVSDWAFWVSC
jgi:hypothetical protein